MSRFSKFDIIDYILSESSSSTIFPPFPKPFALLNPTFPFQTTTELYLLNPTIHPSLDPYDDLHTITDLILESRTPFGTSSARKLVTSLQSLSDRVSTLELGFDLGNDEKVKSSGRKYTWTEEINCSDLDRKYKLTIPSLDPYHDLDTIIDPILVEPRTPFVTSSARKLVARRRSTADKLYLQSLSDRVYALELGFDHDEKVKSDRKYSWTAEINRCDLDRKYKLTTEIKGGKAKKKEKSYKWTAEIKRKGDDARKYTFTASSANAAVEDDSESEKNKKKDKKKEKAPRVVEIQDSPDHGALVLKQAFAKRNKGKKKELSPQDAAMLIQLTFRAYLIRRSQALRALRELAVAKGKLKELRALFNNFSYRRQVARDAEERQRFSEKIIVLLLTVDAIEGADIMVRGAKRSMVDELEAMLDVVDPKSAGGRSLSMKRRTFDMPDGVMQKEVAEGVAQVVRMLEQDKLDDDASETVVVHM